jgi:hypothetical protein
MTERTSETMARASKGPIAPPPRLNGMLATVADTVASWPGVVATAHWDLYDSLRVDGIDFYVGEDELGHIHLDGSIHLATNPSLGESLIAEGLAERFPYARGWVQRRVEDGDTATAIGLFKRNYERVFPTA